MIKHYGIVALVGLSIGMALMLVRSYWPEPDPPTVLYAYYWPIWSNNAVTARTAICENDGVVYRFYAIDAPTGWAFFSLSNLRYGFCLDKEVPESPLDLPNIGNPPMVLN